VIKHVARGSRSKAELAKLLRRPPRVAFLAACAKIERRYTEECIAANGLCPGSRCSGQGEICIVPLLRAGCEYRKACAAEWGRLFAQPANRIPAWQVDASEWRI
jgi:hypothetical protein